MDEEAREWFRKLENGDEEALALGNGSVMKVWWNLTAFTMNCKSNFDSYNGEAFYNDKMDAVVDILSEKGLLVESEGAQVVNLKKYGIEHSSPYQKI